MKTIPLCRGMDGMTSIPKRAILLFNMVDVFTGLVLLYVFSVNYKCLHRTVDSAPNRVNRFSECNGPQPLYLKTSADKRCNFSHCKIEIIFFCSDSLLSLTEQLVQYYFPVWWLCTRRIGLGVGGHRRV